MESVDYTSIGTQRNCLIDCGQQRQAGFKTIAETPQWYAMRDLRRPNARERAWQRLSRLGFRVFTPMQWVVDKRTHKREYRPVISDLLFIYSSRQNLDPEVELQSTLQYRYRRGAQATPMTIRTADMERFIQAVSGDSDTRYFLPGEITPEMMGRSVRLIGGNLNGFEGRLLYIRGSRKKRLIVELPGILAAAVEVQPEYIELI